MIEKETPTFLEFCFQQAEAEKSRLDPAILLMEGMTGIYTRHLYNTICSRPTTRYLEIGCWKGSSTCAALSNNSIEAVTCIDNWSEFTNTKSVISTFLQGIYMYGGNTPIEIIEDDCWTINSNDLSGAPFTVYLYDGPHTQEDHTKALTHYFSCLADEFIFIVDDWNWEQVRTGTYLAISQLPLEIIEFHERKYNTDTNSKTWWNGVAVFLFRKLKSTF